MKPLARWILALAALAVLIPTTAAADTPNKQSLYQDGPEGRYLLDGEWLHRLDVAKVGDEQRFQRQTARAGWTPVGVPHAWNAQDESTESFLGTVGWYRKEFSLPSAKRRFSWIVRFESANYRTKIWLNGRPIGTNTGAYLPFEVRLPNRFLKRRGTNRLVARVENVRNTFDFPPAGLSATGVPTGGWWNYGGLLREVYLRRVDGVDVQPVQALPDLPCATCAATVTVRATVRNYGPRSRRVRVRGLLGSRRFDLGTVDLGVGDSRKVVRRVRIGNPRLWSPERPSRYKLRVTAGGGSYTGRTGIRSVKVVDGRILLNGKPLNFRGVGLHEDDKKLGFAINNQVRKRYLDETQELGANLIRSHYPLHPYWHEEADRRGLMVWSEVPVYAMKTAVLKSRLVRRLAAKELEQNIETNGNHPSIITWSVGNELSARPGPVQGFYLKQAATSAKAIDPTRPVSYAVAGYPAAGCQPEYAPLDIIGVNEYFGWYPGPNGQIADRTTLSAYLDAVRQCYPDKGVVVTEFGAEANRNGPVEEKGTYEFQSDFVNYHSGVYASKPWLSGAVYWALEEFRVRPGWEGGNPRPAPPVHQKGLIDFDDYAKKPAFFELQRIFRGTPVYRSRAPAPAAPR